MQVLTIKDTRNKGRLFSYTFDGVPDQLPLGEQAVAELFIYYDQEDKGTRRCPGHLTIGGKTRKVQVNVLTSKSFVLTVKE